MKTLLPRPLMLVLLGLLVALQACVSPATQAVLPAAVNTDPATAPIVLPEPARPGLPSLILIGDSTVRNGRDDGQGLGAAGQWGWGRPIAAYFDPVRLNVVNRAVGGLSSRTYISSGHWARSLALIKSGDVVLMQFGHNDSSPVNDRSRARGTLRGTGSESLQIVNQLSGKDETVYSYGAYLRRYVADIRAVGAHPVIVSPVPRKRWDASGRVLRADQSYAAWAAEIAREQGVAFIDLNELAAQAYEGLGREAVMGLFPRVTPDETVHTNWAGALLNAQLVQQALRATRLLPAEFFLQPATVPAPMAGRADERPVVDARQLGGAAPRDPRLPSLFLIGDSTVRSAGQNGAYGWGERLEPFLDTGRINLVNHALGGRSSRTFFTEGRWQAVLAQIKPGDWLLIQFGHNDGGRIGDPAMKGRASGAGTGPEVVEDLKPDGGREPVHTFGWYLARYIADARARGASVVVLAPIPHKDRWQNGRDFENFAAWGAEVARAGGAHFIDLTLRITEAYRAVGADQVEGFFADARTHTNEAGARFNAARVIEGLRALPGQPLAPYLK